MKVIELTIKDKIPFGKFKDIPIDLLLLGESKLDDFKDIEIPIQLNYLKWFNETITSHIFDNQIKSTLQKELKRQSNESWEREREYNNKNPKKSRLDWNQWGNYDDRQLMMSESDCGIF